MSAPLTNKLSRRQFFGMLAGSAAPKTADPASISGVVKKIVFGYGRVLPANLVIGSKQLKQKIEEAGLKVEIRYHRLVNLPQDIDILLVAEELLELAHQNAPGVTTIVLKKYIDSPVYDILVNRMLEGVELRAEVEDPSQVKPQSNTIKYRGYEKID